MGRKRAQDEEIPQVEEQDIEKLVTERDYESELTVEDRLQIVDELNGAIIELEKLQNDKKAALKEFKDKIKTQNRIVSDSSNFLTTGKKRKAVQVEITRNYTIGTIEERRLDTGEVVEVRPMSRLEMNRDD